MVIKTEKGFIAIPTPKKQINILFLVKAANYYSKLLHKTNSFHIIST